MRTLLIKSPVRPGQFRGFNSAFNCPWKIRSTQTTSKHFFRYPGISCQISKSVILPIVIKYKICDAIISLFALCCPATIFRLVSAMIIDAIKRCIWWSITHVLKKIIKISPTIANSYTSFFVIFKSWARWVGTARDHALPGLVSWAGFSVPCVAMCWASHTATTRRRMFRSERGPIRDTIITAIAHTLPPPFIILRCFLGNYKQVSKSLTSHIKPFVHNVSPSSIVNKGLLYA